MIATLYGIETIARASELFVYFSSILFFTAMILVLPNVRIENLQPVFEKGIVPSTKGSVFLSCFLTFPVITLMMIFPIKLNNIPKAKKSIFKGYLLASTMIFIAIVMSILVLGSAITANSQFPTYLLTKEINFGSIFTRLEFIVAASWIVTQFIIGILFFYAGAVGISELIGLKDYKKIIMPLGLITLVMSGVVFPDTVYQANWVTITWIPYITTYGLILPVLLVLVHLVKKWVFKRA